MEGPKWEILNCVLVILVLNHAVTQDPHAVTGTTSPDSDEVGHWKGIFRWLSVFTSAVLYLLHGQVRSREHVSHATSEAQQRRAGLRLSFHLSELDLLYCVFTQSIVSPHEAASRRWFGCFKAVNISYYKPPCCLKWSNSPRLFHPVWNKSWEDINVKLLGETGLTDRFEWLLMSISTCSHLLSAFEL